MKVSVTRNRALAFKAALEALRDSTLHLLAVVQLDIEDVTAEEIEARTDESGGVLGALEVFDDALDDAASERNRYVRGQELESDAQELTLEWKEFED